MSIGELEKLKDKREAVVDKLERAIAADALRTEQRETEHEAKRASSPSSSSPSARAGGGGGGAMTAGSDNGVGDFQGGTMTEPLTGGICGGGSTTPKSNRIRKIYPTLWSRLTCQGTEADPIVYYAEHLQVRDGTSV